MQVPIVIFPVSGGGWTLDDAVALLRDLMGQMPARNATCMDEVMAHVKKQGVMDVREVEDVLLAHMGLVPTLRRADLAVGARVSHPKHGPGTVGELMGDGSKSVQFDSGDDHRYNRSSLHELTPLEDSDEEPSALAEHYKRVCAHLKLDEADLSLWLAEHHKVVEHQLSVLSWQSCKPRRPIEASPVVPCGPRDPRPAAPPRCLLTQGPRTIR